MFSIYFLQRIRIERGLKKKNPEVEYKQELLRFSLAVQEEERQRIAQELHDEISSRLSVVSVHTYLLKSPQISPEEVEDISVVIIDQVGGALRSLRSITHNLMPPVSSEFGLDEALQELFEVYNSKRVETCYKSRVDFSDLNEEQQLHLFRMVQELLNNSIRHGNANSISLRFDRQENTLMGSYKDNGIGFDPKMQYRGLGIRNIKNRIRLLNGEITFSSKMKQGCNVVFTLKPYGENQNNSS
ncbi:sensor histidine kinase [Pedobacter sp. ASV28]|uniref:sensor histidine kinase n=1 Tax=Pedobacter sp. ASV28 TaxID=2795123 RepID=UPI001E4168E7|nr:ATP-binding protein [Pedobacter sp. ASV28]